jgi:hypothetical protein
MKCVDLFTHKTPDKGCYHPAVWDKQTLWRFYRLAIIFNLLTERRKYPALDHKKIAIKKVRWKCQIYKLWGCTFANFILFYKMYIKHRFEFITNLVIVVPSSCCEAMTGRNFAGESHFQHVARLPWLLTQPTGTRKIDDTNFYKKLTDGQSTDGIYKHKLFRLLNSVNPFYLPLR